MKYILLLHIHTNNLESDYSLLGSFGVIASISTVPFSQITISIQNDIEMEDNEEFIVRVIPRMGQFSGNLVFTRNFTTVTISNSTESKYFMHTLQISVMVSMCNSFSSIHKPQLQL